jgi:uncharacterized repeat protein (TIGR03803 family)
MRVFYTTLLLGAAIAIGSPAQTFTSLASFDYTNGSGPWGGLAQGINGSLYGTTEFGGAGPYGTVFALTSAGKLNVVYNFECGETTCPNGAYPDVGLVLGASGSFYGGTGDSVFDISPAGSVKTLDTFNGYGPGAPLVLGTDGNYYGTTLYGGTGGLGTVFKMTPAGKLTTLHNFAGTDGSLPNAPMVEGANGNFYGTTSQGGGSTACANGCGTVFTITSKGKLTTLHDFDKTDGWLIFSALIEGPGEDLYGTTAGGGTAGWGTVFKMTPAGALTTVYNFCSETNCTDGGEPAGGFVLGTDGNFYGTTANGGTNTACSYGCGTIFKITPAGTFHSLYSFDYTQGWNPIGPIVQATNGSFFGTTCDNGCSGATNCASGCGTVFRLSAGLAPFVMTVPTSGAAETAVKILGSDLTGTTSVTFNGASATFTVVSATEITTSVPTGATTGKVEVVTPRSTLVSNRNFQVP